MEENFFGGEDEAAYAFGMKDGDLHARKSLGRPANLHGSVVADEAASESTDEPVGLGMGLEISGGKRAAKRNWLHRREFGVVALRDSYEDC